ncbi:MAG TPA: peptidylprolyl isomerase [Flavobacterium sp.]|uniref:peptidylprolyl isomerase n=1 Tax=unclassified Flavobacterium TaxID=196869 RepID=UPI000E98AC41|nr:MULTISPECIES: peptidylprolyl isomerase [unclassified Flavobacterium]HBI01018.1 peptidylprolyl isomerase [Flavobacterium sp.]HRE77323.1 peptidylprolyl isomerase [Flavobacterium sp.]
MNKKHFYLGISILFSVFAFAQAPKKVLFTVDENPYYTDEFVRVYNKNLDLVKDESQKDLDHYLELFVGYKLKINKANKLGLQNNTKYQNELKSYRTQLSKNYLTDSKVTKELLEEGYVRSLKEIKASHILLTVDENAKPEDTLAVFKQIMDLKKRADNGEDFGELAQKFSQDPSAKENKGDLGYFSAFRMVYPFESAAYNTKVGEISNPVRTRFGYHLIKVSDIRNNRGDVTVAHIMLMNPAEGNTDELEKNKTTINEIYTKIQQGEEFEALAKQFSQDKSSSAKGGLLNRFGSGQLSSEEFETVAFSLQKPNEISKPFQSQFGWHIMKLIEKHPVKTFEEAKADMETKISRDERSRKITESLNEKLRAKYTVKRNEALYTKIKKAVTDKFYESAWELPSDTKPFDGEFISFGKIKIPGTQFLNYLLSQQKNPNQPKPVAKLVDFHYSNFVDSQLNQYYNDNLENEFPEFAAVMEEYRDGLLLFDLMEKEIWEKSKTDTLGLEAFHKANSGKYMWKKRYDVLVISSTKADIAKKAHKLIKQGKNIDEIKTALNTKGVINIMATSGVFEEGSETLPKTIPFIKGLSDVVKEDNYYYVVQVNDVKEAGAKLLEECKGRVINDYQQYLEENWVANLKQEFNVSINKDVFEEVKKQIKK